MAETTFAFNKWYQGISALDPGIEVSSKFSEIPTANEALGIALHLQPIVGEAGRFRPIKLPSGGFGFGLDSQLPKEEITDKLQEVHEKFTQHITAKFQTESNKQFFALHLINGVFIPEFQTTGSGFTRENVINSLASLIIKFFPAS